MSKEKIKRFFCHLTKTIGCLVVLLIIFLFLYLVFENFFNTQYRKIKTSILSYQSGVGSHLAKPRNYQSISKIVVYYTNNYAPITNLKSNLFKETFDLTTGKSESMENLEIIKDGSTYSYDYSFANNKFLIKQGMIYENHNYFLYDINSQGDKTIPLTKMPSHFNSENVLNFYLDGSGENAIFLTQKENQILLKKINLMDEKVVKEIDISSNFNISNYSAKISSNKQKLAIYSELSQGEKTFIYNTSDLDLGNSISFPNDKQEKGYDFGYASPNFDYFAYTADNEEQYYSDLIIINSNSRVIHRIKRLQTWNRNILWNNDADKIAFYDWSKPYKTLIYDLKKSRYIKYPTDTSVEIKGEWMNFPLYWFSNNTVLFTNESSNNTKIYAVYNPFNQTVQEIYPSDLFFKSNDRSTILYIQENI